MTGNRTSNTRWPLLLPALAALLFACNLVAPERGEDEEAAVTAEQPAGSDLFSLEPGEETRIYYQFVDAQRQVRFVERLEDVPEQWRAQAGFVEMSSPPPLSPADARKTRNARYGEPQLAAAHTPEVLLYSAEWCGACVMARRHLDRRDVPYRLRDVDVPSAAQELSAKSGGKGIPVLDVGGRIMRGFNADSYDRMLDQAGIL